jgi:hypothetical protein
VEIVENQRPLWKRHSGWRVEDAWSLRIGVASGAPEYEFSRVHAVSRLPDGTILAADDGSREIRLYNSDGGFLRGLGGYGEGPGEFRQLWTAGKYRADSMFGYDYHLRRVNVYGPDGHFGRTVGKGITDRGYWVRGALPDGSFVLQSQTSVDTFSAAGLTVDTAAVAIAGPDGEIHTTVGKFTVAELLIGEMLYPVARHFSARGSLHIWKDRIYWGEGRAFEFKEHGRGGELRRIIRATHTPVEVTPRIVKRFQDAYAEAQFDEGDAASRRRALDRAEYAPTLPAHSEILVDETGHVWAARYHYEFLNATEWEIFSPDGRWLGMVETPAALDVMYIGDEEIMGVAKDELGVEYVQVHELLKAM